MSFKEEFKIRMKQREAKAYFRRNNNEIASMTDYLKIVVLNSVISTVGVSLILSYLNYSMAVGFIISMLCVVCMNRFVRKSTETVKRLAIFCYVFGSYMGVVVFYYNYFRGLSNASLMYIMQYSFSFFVSNIFHFFTLIIGGYVMYKNIK